MEVIKDDDTMAGVYNAWSEYIIRTTVVFFLHIHR